MNKASTLRHLFKWAWQQAKGVRVRIFAACVLGLLRVVAGLSFVWVSKLLVDAATGANGASEDHILPLSILLAALMLVEMGLALTVSYLSKQTEIKLKNSLREKLYTHILYSNRGEQRRMHSGDLLNRLTEDVRVITDVLCVNLPQVIVMVVQLLAAFIFLYAMSPMLSMCVVCILPIFLLLSKVYIKKMRLITSEIRKDDSLIQSNMQEGIQHQPVVQTLECENYMERRLGGLQSILYGETMRRTRFSTFSRAMVNIGFITGYLTAFIWSVWHLHLGVITYGTMTAFLQLVSRIQNPMANLTQQVPAFVSATSSIDRLIEVEDMPLEMRNSPQRLKEPAGIRLTDVTYRYFDGKRDIIKDFSYDFAPGSKTVVMGETGIGKSTLIRLILALLIPQKGKIEVYNAQKTVTASADTRCNMVYVPQGNSLIEGTIRENLLLGNPDATEEQLHEALHTAVADFVFSLPDALDTPCGELGAGLSEGQAQRIAIARALLRNGNILLLDEFNSSLDESTAATLMQRLTEQRADSTIIFISHRPEVANYCDNILRVRRDEL